MRTEALDRPSFDHVLTTTRAVRRRLDLDRDVPLEVVHECLEIALQAPTGFNEQNRRWLVITDPDTRHALGEIVRRIELPFLDMMEANIPADDTQTQRVAASSRYLADHLAEVPVHVIPCTVQPVAVVRDLLDLPPDVSQAGLIPVAHFLGEDVRPARRRPLHEVTYHDRWSHHHG